MIYTESVIVLFAYLIGSIPVGYLVVKKITGKNIFNFGSGNPGSTNVRRLAGKKVSIITQLLDMLKGLLPVALVLFISDYFGAGLHSLLVYIVGLATILGHNFSVFMKFKGGKGVNTTLGASVLLAPYSVFVAVLIYYLVKWKFGYVSLGSIFLGLTLPVVELILFGATSNFYFLLVCALLIVILHLKNIGRLLAGSENK